MVKSNAHLRSVVFYAGARNTIALRDGHSRFLNQARFSLATPASGKPQAPTPEDDASTRCEVATIGGVGECRAVLEDEGDPLTQLAELLVDLLTKRLKS